MTYFEGFIAPVPEANGATLREACEPSSRRSPRRSGSHGMVEAWESDVPEGKVTDFRKAVDAKPDEKIVFSFFEYPVEAGARRREREVHERPAHGRDGQGRALRRQAHDHGRVRGDRRGGPGGGSLRRRLRRAGAARASTKHIAARRARWRRCSVTWRDPRGRSDQRRRAEGPGHRLLPRGQGRGWRRHRLLVHRMARQGDARRGLEEDHGRREHAAHGGCRSTASACSGAGSTRSWTPPSRTGGSQAGTPVTA